MEPFPIRVEPPRATCVFVELCDEIDSELESGEVENRDAGVKDGAIVVPPCFDLALMASRGQARDV